MLKSKKEEVRAAATTTNTTTTTTDEHHSHSLHEDPTAPTLSWSKIKNLIFCILFSLWFGPSSWIIILILTLGIYSPTLILPWLKNRTNELLDEIVYLYQYTVIYKSNSKNHHFNILQFFLDFKKE